MDKQQARLDLVATAMGMLEGKVPFLPGCREICRLRHKCGDPEHEVFLPIRAMESETDHFPLGERRKFCAPEYLKHLDDELDRYMKDARDDIVKACSEIVRVFSGG